MLNKELYHAVLQLIGETNDMAYTADYQERFPYILALFCGEAEDLDDKYRMANKMPRSLYRMRAVADMEEDFPLSDPFTSVAVYFCAAMLINDENSEFSDKLFEKYSSRMSNIYTSLPCEMGKIKNIYK